MSSSVYIIMPVGSDPDFQRRRGIINYAVISMGYSATFPHYEEFAQPFDLAVAKAEIAASSAVLADLTYERPSCYYEVGLAQAVHSRVLLIAQAGTVVHQVYRRDWVAYYESLENLDRCVQDLLA